MEKKMTVVRFGDDDLGARSMSRLFDPWQHFLPFSNIKWQPNTDVMETDDKYIIRMELAGVIRDNIEIFYQDERLVVSGRREDKMAKKPVRYLQLEMNYSEFERILLLPENIDEKAIEAHFEEGVLCIEIPKRKDEMMPRKIRVELK
jgi:HSP20 family protein